MLSLVYISSVAAVLLPGLAAAAAVPAVDATTTTTTTATTDVATATSLHIIPIPPSRDSWYAPPDGWEEASPGTVLKVRPAQGALGLTVPYFGRAWNILYATSDSYYQPAWAVTTLIEPEVVNPDQNVLVSYQIAYDSCDVNTGPSYTLSKFAAYGNIPPNNLDEMGDLLTEGWYVTVPDYEGPLAAFIAGIGNGHMVIDALRSSLSTDLGLPGIPDARLGMWGYSGGAYATEFAAELQPLYAADIEIAATALGGTTPNTFSVFRNVTGSPQAGLIPPGIIGQTQGNPTVQDYIFGQLVPATKRKFLSAYNLTIDDTIQLFFNEDIFSYFVDGAATFDDPDVVAVMDDLGIMGNHGTPSGPIFIYKAIGDEVSPINETDALVAQYCAAGVPILYERNTVGNHESEQPSGEGSAVDWMRLVLNTGYVTTGCEILNVTLGGGGPPGGGKGPPTKRSPTPMPRLTELDDF
ncbi:secretory lipase-domain-containing protein [Xylariales sp. PMI_506]|nr:secretory lipase-domain-containing protein [Xylariales sp. PMI_506]